MIDWEGAEICYYCNGESYSISLSDTQFALIIKLLGIEVNGDEISTFTDETLKQFWNMKGNPLRLVEQNIEEE